MPVPEGRSHICVYRVRTVYGGLGPEPCPWWPIAVSLDGAVRPELSEETFVMVAADSGQHDLVADALPPYRYSPTGSLTIPPERRQPASVAVHAYPNERYFVELNCATGTGTVRTTIGTSAVPVLTTHGGFIELLVKLNAKVTPGQKVAIQRNAFGEVVAEYTSPVNGLVGGVRSDATSEPGNVLLFILADAAPVSGAATYSE
jgi:hypothetical protein